MTDHQDRDDGHHSFNSMRTRIAAGRAYRRSGSMSFFPKRRVQTMSDMEAGTGRGLDDRSLTHATTAPEASSPTRKELGGDGSTQNEVFDSQATTADSPTTNGELRQRKNLEEKTTTGLSRTESGATDGKKKKGKHGSVGQQLKFIFSSWVNVLLVAIPAGFAVNYAGIDGKIVFAVNFVAIIPLAGLLSLATEEIALVFNETIGGLINATFGNAVELIVAIIALLKDEVEVVQTSLVGSILSNLLLVLGMCFFFGGWNRKVQYFNKTVAQTSASLLALAVASNIVPTVFSIDVKNNADQNDQQDIKNIAALSRGTSVILLVVYIAYLYFQLGTHSKIFAERSPKAEKRETSSRHKEDTVGSLVQNSGKLGAHGTSAKKEDDKQFYGNQRPQGEDEEDEEATLHIYTAVGLLLGCTILIAFCAEFMVDGIAPITEAGVSVEFVGLILLPIVGNAAEHATAVTVAIKDKMDLAIGVAVGSSMQVSLFLIPFLVIIGWGKGMDNMTLAFDTFQSAVLFVSVLLVNYLIADGESHWLEGFLLITLYLIIAVCSWWYPAAGVV